ncbi:hypothetical protein FOCC_FOCC007056, partial [Frankliniella occidentalis]
RERTEPAEARRIPSPPPASVSTSLTPRAPRRARVLHDRGRDRGALVLASREPPAPGPPRTKTMASTNNNNYYIDGAGGPGIPAWFAGRHVLVTGATGFMGKVLVEKLLRSCGDLERLYIVVRQKKGRAVQERVDDMRKLPLFEPLLKRNPKALEKLHALEGDTTQVAMGLREEDQRLVQENVSVVFHLAAGLDWRASLHRATTENVVGTKNAVAEALAAEYADDIPMLIVRPSIVVPTLRDPIPGWVDTLNGPMGVMAAAGKGVLRSMMCRAENLAEVPRDQREVIVYNACAGDLEETTWGEVLALGRKMVGVYPLEWTVWFPDGSIRTNYWEHMLIVFLFQTIPAYVIDFLLMLIGQERFMVRVQAKIKSGHDLLMFFTMRQWKFNNRNGRDTLWPTLNAKDRETFFMNNVLPVDKEKYLERAIFGTRTYCLKESPGTIKYCRRRLRVQQVVHNLCVALFYMGLVYAALQMASPYLLQLLPATLRERTVLMAATYSS